MHLLFYSLEILELQHVVHACEGIDGQVPDAPGWIRLDRSIIVPPAHVLPLFDGFEQLAVILCYQVPRIVSRTGSAVNVPVGGDSLANVWCGTGPKRPYGKDLFPGSRP